MSKFNDALQLIRAEYISPSAPGLCVLSPAQVGALLECAGLIYETKREPKRFLSMPLSVSMAIRRIEESTPEPCDCIVCDHE